MILTPMKALIPDSAFSKNFRTHKKLKSSHSARINMSNLIYNIQKRLEEEKVLFVPENESKIRQIIKETIEKERNTHDKNKNSKEK